MSKVALFVFAAVASMHAQAGPKEAVHDAFSKFLAQKSFRATVTDLGKGEQISTMEFVAPDRYHLRANRGPETIIVGDGAWMDMGGHLTRVPIPVGKMVAQYRNDQTLRQLESGIVVTDLGSESVGAEPAHAYHYTVTEPIKADVKLWVGDRTGLPLQLESQGSFMGISSKTRVSYSDFNDPSIKIAAPDS